MAVLGEVKFLSTQNKKGQVVLNFKQQICHLKVQFNFFFIVDGQVVLAFTHRCNPIAWNTYDMNQI